MTLEEMLIENCSATLASIKTANLFNMDFTSEEDLRSQLVFWNTCMQEKGIRLFLLKVHKEKALVYVYRKKQLQEDLKRPGVAEFLQRYGYESLDVDDALERLKTRICQSEVFPHEIGVFLDYPLGDVEGFIINHGRNFKFSGLWKVYGNENETRKVFEKYKKCRDVYSRLWREGRSVMQLTVAV